MVSRLFACLLFLASYSQAVEVNDELFAAVVNRLSAVEEKGKSVTVATNILFRVMKLTEIKRKHNVVVFFKDLDL